MSTFVQCVQGSLLNGSIASISRRTMDCEPTYLRPPSYRSLLRRWAISINSLGTYRIRASTLEGYCHTSAELMCSTTQRL